MIAWPAQIGINALVCAFFVGLLPVLAGGSAGAAVGARVSTAHDVAPRSRCVDDLRHGHRLRGHVVDAVLRRPRRVGLVEVFLPSTLRRVEILGHNSTASPALSQ